MVSQITVGLILSHQLGPCEGEDYWGGWGGGGGGGFSLSPEKYRSFSRDKFLHIL